MMSKGIVNPDNVIIDLYKIIDNIDTYADMCKGNYEAFYISVIHEINKESRWDALKTYEGILHGMEPVNDTTI